MIVRATAPAFRGALGSRILMRAAAVAIVFGARPVFAQSACGRAPGNVRVVSRHWPAPLDRAMCLDYRSVAVGTVLTELLRGTELEPVVAGDDQIVLAPARRSASTDHLDDEDVDRRRTSVLDRVVVTGVASDDRSRAVPIAADVISGDKLAHQQTASLSHLLDGSVPGVWVWQQSPTTLMARYGSVRGASSFGLSYPKIYIDGIEVANPLLMQQFDPATIERMEVIRGPQGSALYGADANSGVINIVTRHDGVAAGGQRVALESTAGVSGSQFAPQGVLTQQHSLAFRTGSAERSGGFGLSLGTLGAYVPGAFAQTVAANGDIRMVGSRSVFTGTARLLSERAGTPSNPLLPRLTNLPGYSGMPQRSAPSADSPPSPRWDGPDARSAYTSGSAPQLLTDTTATQSVSQYTVGGTLAWAPNDRWTHSFVLGVDGYRLANPALDNGPIPSATDSALAAARGGGDRITARISSSARFGATDQMSTVLTFTAEHAAARDDNPIATTTLERAGTGARLDETTQSESRLIGWHGNSGLVAQANTSLRNRVFLTAGMRLERDDALIGSTRTSALPMLGGAVVGDRGDVTLKVRAAYGKGIRPVQGAIRQLAWSGRGAALVGYDLAPEQQAGVEAGADLFVGRALGFHVTRYDQQATGLIQSVAVAVPGRSSRGLRFDEDGDADYVAYQLQNVGEISNRGWELQGTADVGRLSLASSLSLVDSRVQRVASGYTGDLQPGDRMLEVPGRTASVSGSWHGTGWFSSLTLARASNWTGYDRVAVARALTSGTVSPSELVGERLRGFWRTYDGVTRLRASFSRDLFRGLTLVFTGDNLLGQQRGEPDNATVVPGRTITAGLKAKF